MTCSARKSTADSWATTGTWRLQCLWGNSAATAANGYPQWDGFDSLLNSYSGTTQNAIDFAGGSMTLGALDRLADMVESNVAMSVFNSRWMYLLSQTAYSKMSQLLANTQRFVDQVEIAAGLLVPTYRGIPLVKTSFLSTRSYQMGTVTSATATTGGTLAATTYYYKVGAVIARQGEILASAEVSQATTGSTSTVTLSFSTPTGWDSLQPILYKVYRSTATGTETLLGYVDAIVGNDTSGNPVATVSIIDNGTTLIPANGATQPGTPLAAYTGTNTSKYPITTANNESIFLVPRDEDFLVRPFVREAERLNVATTVAAPDTLPFVLQTDTVMALRAPKFIGGLVPGRYAPGVIARQTIPDHAVTRMVRSGVRPMAQIPEGVDRRHGIHLEALRGRRLVRTHVAGKRVRRRNRRPRPDRAADADP